MNHLLNSDYSKQTISDLSRKIVFIYATVLWINLYINNDIRNLSFFGSQIFVAKARCSNNPVLLTVCNSQLAVETVDVQLDVQLKSFREKTKTVSALVNASVS